MLTGAANDEAVSHWFPFTQGLADGKIESVVEHPCYAEGPTICVEGLDPQVQGTTGERWVAVRWVRYLITPRRRDELMVSNTSATHTSETTGVSVPPQRVQQSDAVREAAAGLAAVEQATARLLQVVAAMDDAAARGASALPGWTRGHVLTHLARNADGLVNLLTWARTGVEHPMYASRADRDVDIEEGAPRSLWLLEQDIVAACGRFAAAATGLGDSAWQAEVVLLGNRTVRAHQVPWKRVSELWIHLVDLAAGVSFDDVPPDVAERIIGDSLAHYRSLPARPSFRLTVGSRTWDVAGDGDVHDVTASTGGALAWVTGRGAAGIPGDVPVLPAWL